MNKACKRMKVREGKQLQGQPSPFASCWKIPRSTPNPCSKRFVFLIQKWHKSWQISIEIVEQRIKAFYNCLPMLVVTVKRNWTWNRLTELDALSNSRKGAELQRTQRTQRTAPSQFKVEDATLRGRGERRAMLTLQPKK